jgi:hypothetical protein
VIPLTSRPDTLAILLVALIIVLTAGCSSVFNEPAPALNTSPDSENSAPSYVVTLHQPVAQSAYVQMDTDLYNLGEVVQFTVTNRGSGTLDCAGEPPAFSVKFQGINGAWVTRLGTVQPNETRHTVIEPGASTQQYAFVTAGWEPGRYRIVHDCGVVRPSIATVTPGLVNETPAGNATVPR